MKYTCVPQTCTAPLTPSLNPSVPGLFAAMSIHLSMAGFLEPVHKVDRIAKHRLRVSMMAMKELSGYWPVCTWIFQAGLFRGSDGRGNEEKNKLEGLLNCSVVEHGENQDVEMLKG